MDTRERFGPPRFHRDPRSLPLVRSRDDLPLWPEAWGRSLGLAVLGLGLIALTVASATLLNQLGS